MNYEKEKKDTEPRDKWEGKKKRRRRKARLQDFRKKNKEEDRDEAEGRDTRLHCAFRF